MKTKWLVLLAVLAMILLQLAIGFACDDDDDDDNNDDTSGDDDTSDDDTTIWDDDTTDDDDDVTEQICLNGEVIDPLPSGMNVQANCLDCHATGGSAPLAHDGQYDDENAPAYCMACHTCIQ